MWGGGVGRGGKEELLSTKAWRQESVRYISERYFLAKVE